MTAFGSRGDIQPLLALGLRMRDQGYRVTIAAAPNYRRWIENLGFRFAGVGGDFGPWLKQQDTKNPFVLLKSLAGYIRRETPLCFAQTLQVVRGADLVVTTTHIASQSAAELAGVPCRTVLPTVQMLPSGHYPPMGFPWQGLPTKLNRLLWQAMDLLFNRMLKGPVNSERAKLGMGPIRSFLSYMRGARPIVTADQAFMDIPSDVSSGPIQTGSLTLPAKGDLEPDMETFLNGGDPPIYIGFGSMVDRTPEKTTKIILDAIRLSGQRAILCAGWADLALPSASAMVLMIREAPHALLFPRVAVVVYHGGAGTTAAALRAGVPQIVVPHLGDQFFHARRVYELGIGPKPIPRSKLNARRLAEAINAVLGMPEMRRKAEALADEVRRIDGVALTIEALLTG